MKVTVYTDGSCLGNPGPGGWAATLSCAGKTLTLHGGKPMTTNNQMELTAVLEAVRAIRKPCTMIVYADSAYVVNNFSRVPFWRARGWRTTTGPVKNAAEWQALHEMVADKGIDIRFVHVAGHAGIPENEAVDAVARSEAELQR